MGEKAGSGIIFGGLLDGTDNILDNATWIALRPVVQFFSPPFGLFTGREQANSLLAK